jgi:photosystem II stability/assembly factor-like uncharacterized protein
MWVNGDHLFRSLDRGDTWTERTLPSNMRSGSMAFVSADEGWLLATSPAASPCTSQQFTLWKTTDGARTWTRLDARGISDARCKGAVQFSGPSAGFLPVWDENAAPAIYRTSDGGATWSLSSPLPDPPGFTTRGGGMTLRPGVIGNFGNTLLVSAVASPQFSTYHAFRSTDGGATWSHVTAGPESGVPIVFVTPTRWLQIILPSASRETTDGGATWHSFASDYQQAAPVPPQIVFGDASTGYATVRGGFARTTDGGAHWTGRKTPGT